MKKLFHALTAIALFALMISMTACKETQIQTPPEIEPSNTVVSQTEVEIISVTEIKPEENDNANPVIHADITTDEHFDKFDVIYTIGNDEYEDYFLWCECEMTDFRIINIYYDEKGWVTDDKEIFSAKKIPVTAAVNYVRMVPEGFPVDAIVYTAKDKTYMYAVGYNGRDGGISLMEIENLIVDPDYRAPSFAEDVTDEPAEEPETPDVSTETMVEVFWVSDDLDIFALEYTIESDSKWHVWKALKAQNKQIPTKCSLKSGEMVKGRNGIMELNFSKEFMDIGSSMNGRVTLQAIANTYISAYDLQAVRFMVEGKYLESAICGYAEEFAYTDC